MAQEGEPAGRLQQPTIRTLVGEVGNAQKRGKPLPVHWRGDVGKQIAGVYRAAVATHLTGATSEIDYDGFPIVGPSRHLMSRPRHARDECPDDDELPGAVALRTSPRTDRGVPDALRPPGHERRHPQTVELIRDRGLGRRRSHLGRLGRQGTVDVKSQQSKPVAAAARLCGDHLCGAIAAAENAKAVDLAGSRLFH